MRTPPANADASFDRSLHKRDFFLFVSLAAIWALATVFVQTPAPVDKSIAILSFENRGHDPQGADLAFGVRLDLHTQLEKLRDIKIIARASAETIDQDLPVADLARQLGVAFIMKGTIERILGRVRVSVSLIDAESGQAWSFVYDRKLDVVSLFGIRDDIAAEITGNLRAELSPQELQRIQSQPTENFDAYQAYLLGKQRLARRTTGALAQAIDLALVLIKTGEQDRADMILDRALKALPTIPRLGRDGYGISDVLIYALQGKIGAALTALRQAIDEGWRSAWWLYLEHDPNLDSIRDEPEFQAMLAEIKADMAAQLERVRAMEANGEFEPVPDIE